MSSPFERTKRPSIFATDPAFRAPKTAKALDVSRKDDNPRRPRMLPNEGIIAYSRAVPAKKGAGNA